MLEETKLKAIEKLDKMNFKIVCPTKENGEIIMI